MRTQENVTIDMIPEFEFSKADTLKVKAWAALDLQLKGFSETAACTFCRISPQEVAPYVAQWEQMHNLV